MPGETEATVTVWASLTSLPRFTCTDTSPGSTSKGTCALICPSETENRGEAVPLKVTLVSSKVVGRGTLSADRIAVAKFVPKMETIAPGAPAPPDSVAARKLAPFTIPPVFITGLEVWLTAVSIRTILPTEGTPSPSKRNNK